MANHWFRMYAEFSSDPKVQRLSELDQRRFVMLLCIRCNGDVTLHDDDVTFILRISPEEWHATKATLISKKLIDENGKPLAWAKRQHQSDVSAPRVAKHRALQKQKCNGDVTLQKQKCNVLEEKRREENREEEIKAIAIGKPNCPHQEIINLYHEILPVCPQIKDWTASRSSLLKKRWDEDSERQNLDYWRGLFNYIASVKFLTGRTETAGRKPFLASLPWIVKAENFAKIREGFYA